MDKEELYEQEEPLNKLIDSLREAGVDVEAGDMDSGLRGIQNCLRDLEELREALFPTGLYDLTPEEASDLVLNENELANKDDSE